MSCVGCSVLNCFNNKTDHPGKNFHFFPKNESLCQIWIEKTNPALKNKPISCVRGYLVCSDHFEPRQYTTKEKIKLNRGSVPVLKLPRFLNEVDINFNNCEDLETEKEICQNIENEYTTRFLSIKTDLLEYSTKIEDLYKKDIFSEEK